MTDIIQRLKEQKNENGVSLFQHIQDLFNQLCEKKSIYANYDSVELLSDLIKQNRFLYNSLKNDSDFKNIQIKESLEMQWVQKCQKILEKQQSQKEEASQIRFWGKIFCKGKDYYIAEGIINTQFRDKAEINAENSGVGCNKLTFWANNDLLNDWTELPQITPEQLKISRKLKLIMTGDLNYKFNSYPQFPGQESHFLKTQLVRITYSSLLGIYKTNEENPTETEIDEEGKMPELTELMNIDNWVHLHPNILNQGRVSYFLNQNLSEEDRETELSKLGESDPIIERLKSPTDEKPLQGYEQNFVIKTLGSTQQYNQIGALEGQQQSYHTIMIKSNIWPGQVTVAKNGTYASIYVGYGMKNVQQSFEPQRPNEIQNDPNDQDEMYEPNPKNAPKIETKVEGEDGQEKQDDE